MPAGTWYLVANGFRLVAHIVPAGGGFTGTLDTGETLDSITWDPVARLLQFRRVGAGSWQWYRATLAQGVLAGRFSSGTTPGLPALTAFQYHVTGWSPEALDADVVPRAWELLVNGSYRARLRIDRTGAVLFGTFKVYASIGNGISDEGLEEDITVQQWDGAHLTFTRGNQVYSGTATGAAIAGAFAVNGAGALPWSGQRAEVLTHGLAPMTPASRAAWQDRARSALELLMMAGNPDPVDASMQAIRSGVAPVVVAAYPPDRDDDPTAHPQAYTLTELAWTHTLPNPYGGPPITRLAHGYLAVPNGLQSGETRPAVLALNGHGGSGYACMDGANGFFWYGDGWARRGYVVLALDIGHRNDSPLYSDEAAGDDPAHGNGPHPSIKAAGFDTDWEENGERTWDCMRAMDYLLGLPYVDPARIVCTGLSLGGEMAAFYPAMDPRVAVAIPAGFSPDLSVLFYRGAHPCWQWGRADIREYIDTSDLLALIAPRPVVVLTGKQDTVYSGHVPPWSGDKQVMRRAASAYADAPGAHLHYLHYDVHAYHVGGYSTSKQPPAGFQNGVQIVRVTAPTATGSTGWQTDAGTQPETLFDVVARLLP